MMQNRLKYNACHGFMNFIGQENQTKPNYPKPKKTQTPATDGCYRKAQAASAGFQQLSLLFPPSLSKNAKFRNNWASKIKEQ